MPSTLSSQFILFYFILIMVSGYWIKICNFGHEISFYIQDRFSTLFGASFYIHVPVAYCISFFLNG